MSSDTGTLIAAICFLLAAFYTAFQLLRLIFPVWAWRYEKNALNASELLERALSYATPRQIAESAPAQSCFNRLMQERNITPEERPFQVKFRRRILLVVIFTGLLMYLRFTANVPAEAPLLALDLVLVSVGMMFGDLARYRIWRTQSHVRQMLQANEAVVATKPQSSPSAQQNLD